MEDLIGIAERKARVRREKKLFLLKAQTRVMTDSPSPSAVGGVLRSIFTRHVKLLMGPPDIRADPEGPTSLPLIQPKSRRKPLRTQSSTASVTALMMGN